MDLGIRKNREQSLQQGFDLEKGKKAAFGEIREWKGTKYRKTPTGWDRVVEPKKTVKEDFVDEDTAEIVTIEREVHDEVPPKRTDSPSHERKVRNAEKKVSRAYHQVRDHSEELSDMKGDLKSLKRDLREIDTDMNEEAGHMGDKWNDDKANEYGDLLNKKNEEIVALRKVIEQKQKLVDQLETKESDLWEKEAKAAKLNLKKGESILRGFDLEKGGEGSRGGKIIGHTKSGKPVYENHSAMAEKKYTSKDHDDASYAHMEHNKKTEGKRNEHHSSEFDRHHDTSQHKKKNEEIESESKKEGGPNLKKGGEGSRGGKIVGHAPNGDPIYAGAKTGLDHVDKTLESHGAHSKTPAVSRLQLQKLKDSLDKKVDHLSGGTAASSKQKEELDKHSKALGAVKAHLDSHNKKLGKE